MNQCKVRGTALYISKSNLLLSAYRTHIRLSLSLYIDSRSLCSKYFVVASECLPICIPILGSKSSQKYEYWGKYVLLSGEIKSSVKETVLMLHTTTHCTYVMPSVAYHCTLYQCKVNCCITLYTVLMSIHILHNTVQCTKLKSTVAYQCTLYQCKVNCCIPLYTVPM